MKSPEEVIPAPGAAGDSTAGAEGDQQKELMVAKIPANTPTVQVQPLPFRRGHRLLEFDRAARGSNALGHRRNGHRGAVRNRAQRREVSPNPLCAGARKVFALQTRQVIGGAEAR